MNDFKQMDLNGKRVMALRSIILTFIILAIIVIILIVDTMWLDWLSKKTIMWVGIIGIIVLLLNILIGTLVIPRYRFLIFKYKLDNDKIVVHTGLWFITTKNIPLFRIQNVDIHEGIIMRKYNLANVNLSTAAGNAEINFVTKQEADIIKQHIRVVTREYL